VSKQFYHSHLRLSVLIVMLFMTVWAITAAAAEKRPKTTNTNSPTLTIETVNAKISQLESVAGQKGTDTSEIDTYRQVLGQLQIAEKEREQALFYKQTVDNAEALLTERRNNLAKINKEGENRVPTSLTVDELIRRQNQTQSERQLIQAQLQELENRRTTERIRPEQSGMELADSKKELIEIENRLVADTASGMPAHQRDLLISKRIQLKERVNRLEMERLSHAHRMDQLTLQITITQTRLKQQDALIQQMQERITALQTEDAELAQLDAQQMQQKAVGKHPLILQSADKNAELSIKLAQLTSQAEAAILELEKSTHQKESIRRNQERLQQQIIIGSLDEQPGRLLQKQRTALPKLNQINSRADKLRSRIATSRLESFQIEDQRLLLQTELSHGLLDSYRPENLTDAAWKTLQSELQPLLENRLALLDKVKSAYSRQEKALADLSAELLQLYDGVEQYSELLDRHLLWIPSTTRINGDTFAEAVNALGWFFSPQNWGLTFQALWTGLERQPLRIFILFSILALLLYGRYRMIHTLEQIAPSVGNVSNDSFIHTIKAFVITILLALPWPLLMSAFGWWLTKGSDQPFITALSIGLRRLAVFFLVIQILRYLFIKNGLAEVHFRWNLETGKAFRKNLHWLVIALVPLAFTVGVFEWVENEAYTHALGRLAFLLGLFVTGLFFHRALNPWSGFLTTMNPNSNSRPNGIWYPVTLMLCLGLALLATEGYYYSALNLERMLFISLFAGILTYLIYNLLVRWLLVAERRLALARARAKRQAAIDARVSKEVADAAGEGMPELSEFEEVKLTTVNEQTRRMLRVGASLLLATLLYFTWEQLTPALSWLNDIVLWQFENDSGVTSSISIGEALLALAVLGLTLIAGSNLPGFLEIALLQPMNLALGNRYAVSTISRYTIYAGGTLLVLSLIGLKWDDVQWLVAAMGVGLGFGLKEIFANFFSGILILFERPIRIGDTVTIGDISGTVSRIRIRATTITDWDNKELVVPNKNFITDPLVNWTLTDPITRVVIKVGVAYGSDTESAHKVMMDVIKSHSDVLVEPRPTVFFTGFGDSSLNFDIRVFVSDHLKRMPLIHDLHMALNKALAANGIEIPFPQRDLHLRSIDPKINLKGDKAD
jgi:potassium efflux system protein